MGAGAEGPQLSGRSARSGGSTEKGAYSGSLLSCNCLRQVQPQSTKPPFTFRTSPVTWRAQSEPRNTMALAIPEPFLPLVSTADYSGLVVIDHREPARVKAARNHGRDGIHLGQKSVVPMRRFELGVVASRSCGSNALSQRTHVFRRKQPVGSNAHQRNVRLNPLQRLRFRGIAVRQIEGVHCLRDHQVRVCIEALHELLALVIEIAGHVVTVFKAAQRILAVAVGLASVALLEQFSRLV